MQRSNHQNRHKAQLQNWRVGLVLGNLRIFRAGVMKSEPACGLAGSLPRPMAAFYEPADVKPND